MNKKSIICTLLALSLILVGTGYAYWTDTLNVTTKATTGDLDVTFADLGLYAQYDNEYANKNWSIIDGIGDSGYVPANYFLRAESDYNSIAKPGSIDAYYNRAKGYNQVQFDAELADSKKLATTVGPYLAGKVDSSDNIVLSVDKMYPGYAQTFRTEILNTGSIAAKLSSINFKVSGLKGVPANDTTNKMLGIALLIEREYHTGNETGANVFELCKSMGLSSDKIFEVGGVHFIRLSALNDVKQYILKNQTLLSTPSENRMDLYIAVAMDPDAKGSFTTGSTEIMKNNDDSLSQNTGAQISLNLLWDQFNQGKKINTTNRLAESNHR